MTADDFKAARLALGLSVTEMAEALRLDMPNGRTSVREWESGKRAISGPVSVAVELMMSQEIHRIADEGRPANG
jgi:transcriptional regulator with XRE-family HTH domain